MLYFGDLIPTEACKLQSCPRSHFVTRKGKPTHPPAPFVDQCGFSKIQCNETLRMEKKGLINLKASKYEVCGEARNKFNIISVHDQPNES